MILNDDVMENINAVSATPQQAKEINNDNTLSPIEKQLYLVNPQVYEDTKNTRLPEITAGQADTLAEPNYTSQIKNNIEDAGMIYKFHSKVRDNVVINTIPQEEVEKKAEQFRKQLQQNKGSVVGAFFEGAWEGITGAPSQAAGAWKKESLQRDANEITRKFMDAEEGSQDEKDAWNEYSNFVEQNKDGLEYDPNTVVSNVSSLLSQQYPTLLPNIGVTALQGVATVQSGGTLTLPTAVSAGMARFAITYNYTENQETPSMFMELYNENKDNQMSKELMKNVAEKYGAIAASIEGGFDAVLAGTQKAASLGIKKIFANNVKEAAKEVVKKHLAKTIAKEGVEIAKASSQELVQEIMQNAIQKFMKEDATTNGNVSGLLESAQAAIGELWNFSGRVATGEMTNEDSELVDKIFTPTAVIGAFSSAIGGSLRGKKKSTKSKETKAEAKEPTYNDRLSENIAVQENLTGRTLTQEEFNQVVDNTISEEVASKITEDMSDQEIIDTAVETVNNIQQEEELRQDAEVATASLDAELADNEDIVTEIANQEQTSSLKKEDVQAYNALKENSRNEDERPTIYYVDTDTAKEVIAALEATDNEELKTVVNSSGIAQQIEQAEQNGQDVEVSPEVWEEVLTDKKLFQIAKNGTAVYKDTLTPKKQKELVSKVYENNPDLHQSLEDKSSMLSRAYDVLSQSMSEEQALANAAWLDTQANALWNAMSPEAQAEYESKEAFKSSVMPEIRQVDKISVDNQDNKNYNIVNEGEQNAKETEYKTTDEFRKLQEESRGLSPEEITAFHNDNKQIDEGLRNRFSEVFGGELESRSSRLRYGSRILNNPKTNQNVKFYSNVDANTFHDIFDIVHKYLPKGDAVDVHKVSDYQNNKNYLSSNGMSGFSITPSGDLISVFSLGQNGFLRTIQPIIKQEAKTLDCFDSSVQHLPEMYQKTLGFKTASILDFNYDILVEFNGKEYADYFVKTYGESPVHFMVNTDNDIEVKHFNKDQYDEAQAYQLEQAGTDTLLQRTRGVIAGAFTPSLNLIELSKAQNVNTFMHETGHWVENFLTNLRASGKMNERLTKQWDNYMAKLGVEGEMTTAQRERFTEDMSTYVATGKLPDSKLGALFDFMRNMIMSVWKIIRHRRISQPVRDFFDRLYFTDQEIDNMRLQNKIGLLNKPAGWSDAAYQKYVDTANSVKNETMTKAIGNVAKTEKLRETEEYQKQKQTFYNEKVAELEDDNDYQLRQSIIDNPIYEGSIPTGVELDKRFVTDNKKAQTLEQVVAASDFETADELINFLQTSQDINVEAEEYATEKADEWLAKEHQDITETVKDISDDVLNKVKTNVYNHLILADKDENMFKSVYNNLVADAEAEIANTSVSIMSNPSNFTKSINSLLNQYRVAEFNNNKKKMADLQRRMAIANYMVYRARETQRQVTRFSKHFRKYTRRPKSGELSKLNGMAWDIIHSVLNNFGFTARKPLYDAKTVAGRIQQFVGELLNNSEYTSVFETENERLFLSNPDDTALRSLSTADFQRLDEDLRTFENLAIADKGYKDQAKQDELNNDVEELIKHRKGKTKDIGNVSSYFRMMEHEAKAMLPDDLFVKYQLSLQDGFARAANFTNEVWNKVSDISKKLNKKFKKPFMINGHTFSTNNLLLMMLHSGNQHNFASAVMSVAEKFNIIDLTDEQFLDIIRQAPDEFRVAANEIWAEFAKTTQPILEVGRELNGQEMKIVKPEPIDFGDGGTKLTGGYFPAQKVGYKKSLVDEIINTFKSPDAPNPFDGMFPVYKNKLERLAPHAGLDLDGSSIYGFIARTGQYLHVALPAKQTSKFYSAARDNGGISESEYNFFHEQIKDSLSQTGINGLIQFGALNMRASQLGLNPTTALLQGSIVVTAMAENSIHNTVKALLTEIPHILNPMENGVARAKKLSPYLYQRYDEKNESFFGEVQNTFTAKLGEKSNGKIVNTLKNAYGMMMGAIKFIEAPMTIVAWKAAYLDARAKGMTHEQAVLKGDSIVRRFAGESMQGSSSKIYKSGYVRAFIPYMSYTMNISAAMYAQVRGGKVGSIAQYAGALLFTYILEQTIRAALKYHSGDDEDKKKMGDKYIIDQITSIPNFLSEISGIVFPVDYAGKKLENYYEHYLQYYPNTFQFDSAHPLQFLTLFRAGCIDIVKYIEYKNSGDDKKAAKAKKLAVQDLGKSFGVNTYQVGRWFNKFVELLQEKK